LASASSHRISALKIAKPERVALPSRRMLAALLARHRARLRADAEARVYSRTQHTGLLDA
jgi:hypothetical protein